MRLDVETTADYINAEENFPDAGKKNYLAKSYFGDRRPGYDVQLFTNNELIGDVVKHFERYYSIVSDKGNELFVRRGGIDK